MLRSVARKTKSGEEPIIHVGVINSLLPLESVSDSPIRDAGWYGSMLLASNNASRNVFRILSNI